MVHHVIEENWRNYYYKLHIEITDKFDRQNLIVVLVSECRVNTPITELGDIARHSARWRGINRNLKEKKKGAVYTPLITVCEGTMSLLQPTSNSVELCRNYEYVMYVLSVKFKR